MKRSKQPEWVQPMLATLTEDRFSDPAWIFERKLDGERCLVFHERGRVRLVSRNRLPVNGQYPELVEALGAQEAPDFIVDGEIVAFEGSRTSFAKLQRRMHVNNPDQARRSGAPVFYYLFDILHVDGYDVTNLPLRDRKSALRHLIDFADPLRFTAHRNRRGQEFYHDACSKGWEGLIAKKSDAPYEHRRSRYWLKFKCVFEQEFVIGGYTDPQGSRTGFGALLIGYHDGPDLVYAGKVGTGFDRDMLDHLTGRMRDLGRDGSAFTRGTLPRRGAHWLEPVLVGQVGFSEWTDDGQLRHPRFQGLRQDKQARAVVREQPV